jgi:hypothetical protein
VAATAHRIHIPTADPGKESQGAKTAATRLSRLDSFCPFELIIDGSPELLEAAGLKE